MGAQVGERKRTRGGAERKTSNVKMTGTPRVFKTELNISLHIPGQLRAWKTPSLCVHMCTYMHSTVRNSWVGQRNNKNNVNYIEQR